MCNYHLEKEVEHLFQMKYMRGEIIDSLCLTYGDYMRDRIIRAVDDYINGRRDNTPYIQEEIKIGRKNV